MVGCLVGKSRGGAAAGTWIVRGNASRRRAALAVSREGGPRRRRGREADRLVAARTRITRRGKKAKERVHRAALHEVRAAVDAGVDSGHCAVRLSGEAQERPEALPAVAGGHVNHEKLAARHERQHSGVVREEPL